MAQQFELLKASAIAQIQQDLESAVEADRILAETARTGAETARTGSETAQGLSETARDDSQTARDDSQAARDKSQEWATNPEDEEVESGLFSAFHWATKAEASAGPVLSALGDINIILDEINGEEF